MNNSPTLYRNIPALQSPDAQADSAPDTAEQNQVHLSPTQESALEWLTGGGSVAEAAQFAGVTRQAIYKWLRTDIDFKSIYDDWREHSLELAHGRMIALTEDAMNNLTNAVREKRDLPASQFVLKQLGVGRQT